eukprot:TRINITY_DN8384_c0_g1_i2.p1 TRINITY_DN8384_c0_g1~~TRINITY_DN8384_c0_g1_i2.p1  ORF type:complete len:131 (+),score=6.44 TRINITY_DN8384_c0_g1_i2:27-419(+)
MWWLFLDLSLTCSVVTFFPDGGKRNILSCVPNSVPKQPPFLLLLVTSSSSLHRSSRAGVLWLPHQTDLFDAVHYFERKSGGFLAGLTSMLYPITISLVPSYKILFLSSSLSFFIFNENGRDGRREEKIKN